ncbi:unnamed protein product [Rhizoctonia solani]|uniref:Vacuolar fusion protein MON1 n=1 Tax=Rhizoctonia solani TaxID=456999 RepID=A0A8H3BBP7_9AGAM|nr:unnamed protein product [Rhizoctonia solani]
MEPNEGSRTPTRSRAPSRSRAPTPSPATQHVPGVASPTSSINELTVVRESGDTVATVLPSEDHTPLEDERVAPVQLDEDVTIALRTQLRKTLNRMGSVPPTPSSAGAVKSPFAETRELGEEQVSPGVAPEEVPLSPDAVVQTLEVAEPQVDQYPPREYFILTHAGKPVFARSGSSSLSGPSIPPSTHSSLQSGTSSSSIPTVGSPATLPHLPGSGTATPIPGPIFLPPSAAPNPPPLQPAPIESREEDVSSAMGLLQALVSVFADDGDRIRCINAGRTRITFVLRAPLYYACVSSWGEPESVTRLHLDYLHLQILTTLTGTQLQRIFERRGNFDLRRLLDGTDPLIHALTARLATDMSVTLASLHTLRIDPILRLRAAELVLPSKDTKDVLYVILFSGDKVITLVRPRKHSIHPSDLHLLLNTLSAPALRSSASASWLPICLPKFNPQGFLYCYVSFLDVGQDSQDTVDETPIGLAFITPDRDGFEKIRNLASGAETAMSTANVPNLLAQAARASPYPVSDLGVKGLLHFLYKSRTLVQVTHPIWDDSINQPRLITLYQTIHDALHAKSGQIEGPAKLQLIRTDTECVMGWITQPFELYLAVEPTLPKNAIVDLLVSGSQPRAGSRDFALPRLAFLSGLVLGLKELEKQDATVPQHNVSRSCAELVVSVAECLDVYAPSESDPIPAWDSNVTLRIPPNEQLAALDLSKLTCVCVGSVLHLFQNGFYFKLLESELAKQDSGRLGFKSAARFPDYIKASHNSSIYIHLGSIARLIGHLFLASQSVLDTIIYYSAVTSQEGKLLSRGILMAFCRLSFVSTKFGALTAEGGGFSEMKRAFFGALDVLAFNSDDKDTAGDQSCIKLVVDLSTELSNLGRFLDPAHSIWQGRVVYFLVCTEHVISQLSEQVMIDVVLPIVQRHLSDMQNREVYEAAHSVMLAIFAAQENQHPLTPEHVKLRRTHLLVPAYIDILLRNSEQDQLSTDQLCLAFQALVRCASAYEPDLGWFCVERLVDTLKQLTAKGPEKQDQILRLQLSLVSAISAVSTSKLLPVLGVVYDQIIANSGSQGTLAEAAYREIVERLGDREKDIALRWWMNVKSNVGAL